MSVLECVRRCKTKRERRKRTVEEKEMLGDSAPRTCGCRESKRDSEGRGNGRDETETERPEKQVGRRW